MDRSEVTLRSVPNQARSKETFERILSVAIELLDELGWDGFNTNVLAERAGYRVSAVYRYFPNKESVVLTLAQRVIEEWGTWLESFSDDLEETDDFILVWQKSIDVFYKSIKALPGGLAIRRAMKASSVLAEIDQEDTDQWIKNLSGSLLISFPHLTRSRSNVAAQLLMETSVTIMDKAIDSSPATARSMLSELKLMHAEYIKMLFA